MKKQREKERASRQRRWDSQNESVKKFHAARPHVKKLLRTWGCNLPFYDYLDSYVEEFEQISKMARQRYPTLRAIHEAEDSTYFSKDWSKNGYGGLKLLPINFDEQYKGDYGLSRNDANLCGCTAIFHDVEGRLSTGIMIRQAVKGLLHQELKYGTKIVALLHEIGHVHDIENGINFCIEGDAINADIIEAEVFANLYALEKLAERQLRQSYLLTVDAIQTHAKETGYLAEVCRRVLDRLPSHNLVDWQESLRSRQLTEADAKVLGRNGVEAIKNMK